MGLVRKKDAGIYSPIARSGETALRMDFGILRIPEGESYENADDRERAFLLMGGTLRFQWGDSAETCERTSLLDAAAFVLQVPAGMRVLLRSMKGEAECAVQAVKNDRPFSPRLWKPGDYRRENFGEGTMQDTSTRRVSTFFDAATAEYSQMVFGEVLNWPGKWSSYPPHTHAQPEIYHYRFFPPQGFGFSQVGDQVFRVEDGDSVIIPPGVEHPQTAAPGYAMYYIWGIPHLPEDRFGPDSRIFAEDHAWLLKADAPIWPDADLSEVLLHHQHKKSKM